MVVASTVSSKVDSFFRSVNSVKPTVIKSIGKNGISTPQKSINITISPITTKAPRLAITERPSTAIVAQIEPMNEWQVYEDAPLDGNLNDRV
jgi:hypothetical protein